MKYSLSFLLLFLVLISCSLTKQPIFVKVDDVKLVRFSSSTIRLKAVAFFENPNHVGGSISTDQIKVVVNGVQLVHVFSDEFKVPSEDKFTVPLHLNIPAKDILSTSNKDFLSSLVNTVLTNEINVQIKGSLMYHVVCFKKEILIDKTAKIKF